MSNQNQRSENDQVLNGVDMSSVDSVSPSRESNWRLRIAERILQSSNCNKMQNLGHPDQTCEEGYNSQICKFSCHDLNGLSGAICLSLETARV